MQEIPFEAIMRSALGESTRLRHVERWGGGAHATGYRVELAGPGGCYFLKVEKPVIWPRTRRGMLSREVHAVQRLAPVGVPCPGLVTSDVEGVAFGVPYALFEFVDAPLVGEVWGTLSEGERMAMREDVGRVLQIMRQTVGPAYGDTVAGSAIGQHVSWSEAYRAMIRVLLEDAEVVGALGGDEQALAREAMDACSGLLDDRHPPSFLHLDLHGCITQWRVEPLARKGCERSSTLATRCMGRII